MEEKIGFLISVSKIKNGYTKDGKMFIVPSTKESSGTLLVFKKTINSKTRYRILVNKNNQIIYRDSYRSS